MILILKTKGAQVFAICEKVYLKLNLLKTHQVADYSTEKLPESVIEYAALDSIVSRRIGEILIRESKAELSSDSEPNCFKEGEEVTVRIGGKMVCTGILSHIGGNNNDVLWGSMIVNDGKALVKIGTISYPQIKMPHSDGTFNKNNTSLGSYTAKDENKFIVVPLSSVCKLVSNISTLDRGIDELNFEGPPATKNNEDSELSRKSTTSENHQLDNSA